MTDVKTYRLGNQPQEYPLLETYLGWLPEGFASWRNFQNSAPPFKRLEPLPVTLVNPDGTEKAPFLFRHFIIRAAFPQSFDLEEHPEDWLMFCIVTTVEKPDEEFIIPLH